MTQSAHCLRLPVVCAAVAGGGAGAAGSGGGAKSGAAGLSLPRVLQLRADAGRRRCSCAHSCGVRSAAPAGPCAHVPGARSTLARPASGVRGAPAPCAASAYLPPWAACARPPARNSLSNAVGDLFTVVPGNQRSCLPCGAGRSHPGEKQCNVPPCLYCQAPFNQNVTYVGNMQVYSKVVAARALQGLVRHMRAGARA